MGFEDDVFISYAHVDNETLAAGQDGWVSLLTGDAQRARVFCFVGGLLARRENARQRKL